MDNKELYYCEKCKNEFWLTSTEADKKGSLCPNGCTRNYIVFLGKTDEEIAKRRKEFLEKEEIEINEELEEESSEEYIQRRNKGKSEDYCGLIC